VQDNHSDRPEASARICISAHLSAGKLCRVVQGAVFDVAVDIDPVQQPSASVWSSALGREPQQIYVPRGFAHGFLVLSDTADSCTSAADFYHPEDEGGLAWNDPQVGIEWPFANGTSKVTNSSAKETSESAV
jgi:dTDP-4-dehydrorhamnose 3,5-epimerase